MTDIARCPPSNSKELETRVFGGDVDESPMAYRRRLSEVLEHHAGTIEVEHVLRPFAVFMAGSERDPYKD